jgi:hypothetical protein
MPRPLLVIYVLRYEPELSTDTVAALFVDATPTYRLCCIRQACSDPRRHELQGTTAYRLMWGIIWDALGTCSSLSSALHDEPESAGHEWLAANLMALRFTGGDPSGLRRISGAPRPPIRQTRRENEHERRKRSSCWSSGASQHIRRCELCFFLACKAQPTPADVVLGTKWRLLDIITLHGFLNKS